MMFAQGKPESGGVTGMSVFLRLDELLEEKGKSAYWLAKETGMTEAAVWRLRHNKTTAIRLETLDLLCGALECEPGALFGRTAHEVDK